MYKILYNPLSGKANCYKHLKRLQKIISRKKEPFYLYNVNSEAYSYERINDAIEENDKLIIVGGDGTIHHLINCIDFTKKNNRVFMYKAGSGNDFSRGHKGNLFEITNEVVNLPRVKVKDKEILFVNGVGIGVDAEVCKAINENRDLKIKTSYYKTAIKCLKSFKPFSLDIEIDGTKNHFDNVWFCCAMNGKYMGGGMKMAPKAVREDDHLDIYVVHDLSLKKLLTTFPLIFFGKHLRLKANIFEAFGKEINITATGCDVFQTDGESFTEVNSIEIKR